MEKTEAGQKKKVILQSSIVKGGPLRFEGIRRLLIIQLGDIGDVVLSTPSLVALREKFPQSEITVAVRSKASELIKDCPLVDKVIVAEKNKGSFFKRTVEEGTKFRSLRKANFDLVIDFRTGTRGAIMAWLSGAPQRISFYAENETFWRNWGFTHLVALPYPLGTYVANYYHQILLVFGLSAEPGPIRLWINPDRQQRVDRFCLSEGFNPRSPFVVIQPFSLWSYKELPLEHYVHLIKGIHQQYDIPVVMAGSPSEREKARMILDRCQGKVFNLAGKTSIGELAALLSRAFLFVGIDSSGLHMAAAVGCPTVGIFGPSASASWAPRGEQHKVVHPDDPCVPCRNKGCDDTEVSQCLQRLPVEKILAVIEKQLQVLNLKPIARMSAHENSSADADFYFRNKI